MTRLPDVPRMRRSIRIDALVVAAILAAIVQLIVVWTPNIPLGVPGEWTWSRIGYASGEFAIIFLRLFVVVPAVFVYYKYCSVVDRNIPTFTLRGRNLSLVGLTLCGFAWLWVVQDSSPASIDRLGRVPVVQFYPAFSGYFSEARNADDFTAYLANYEEKMAQGDVLHLGTHPPGLITLHRGLLAICRRSPALVTLIRATRPESVRETEEMLRALPGDETQSLTDAELAVLWAAGLLAQFAAAATVFPLFWLIERTFGPGPAWRAATLWPCVPALAIFLPKSDAVLPLVGMSLIALWFRPSPPSVARAAAAGLVFWLGMMISLAMLPVAVLAGTLTATSIATTQQADRRRSIRSSVIATVVAGGVFVGLSVLVWLVLDLNLWTTWRWNFLNHAGFYDVYERTYAAWLLVTPLELALAVGLPVAASVVAACGTRFRVLPFLPVLGVVALLWLSGKNLGETARLWLFLMPWLLWLTAPVWNAEGSGTRWRCVLVLQMAVGFLTAIRISGFGFDEYLAGRL